MDRLRIEPKTFMIGLYLSDQINALIEVVPVDSIHKANPVHKADTDLGAKLRCRSCLAAYDGTDMRLADADNTIVNASASMGVHPLLLIKDLRYHQQLLVPLTVKNTQPGLLG